MASFSRSNEIYARRTRRLDAGSRLQASRETRLRAALFLRDLRGQAMKLRNDAALKAVLGSWRISVERLPPTRAEITAIYDRKARHWSSILHRLGYDQAYRNLFRRLEQSRALGHLRNGGRVLDCGIGAGALSLALLESLHFKFHLPGIDLP